ncbi:MAG: YceD family protein [Rhodospirillales bacterium]|nr:YceD family protein [Rhodospirillales bacterium]
MTMTTSAITPEFSRPLALAAFPPAGQRIEVAASSAECQALARRFGLPSIERLSCTFTLQREPGGAIHASGLLIALLTQVCCVSLDEFAASIEERFTVRFVPSGNESTNFDPDAPDEIPYAGGVLDLGEAAAEQLALALDPWPRKPDAPTFHA